MKILVFAASNSRTSINRQLASHAAHVLEAQQSAPVEIDIIDLNDFEMPIYSPEREKAGGVPAEAKAFYERIGAADGVIVSFAEHNGSYTAAFKNTFDWVSRIDMKVYRDKPVVMLATSPGPRGGQNVLKTAVDTAPFFGANVQGSLSVGPFQEKFDTVTGLVQPEDRKALQDAVEALALAIQVPA